MENQITEYLSTPEAARYLHVSRFFLEASRCRGDGPPFCKVGKSVRYRRNDLDEFMRAHRRTETDKARAPVEGRLRSGRTNSASPKRCRSTRNSDAA